MNRSRGKGKSKRSKSKRSKRSLVEELRETLSLPELESDLGILSVQKKKKSKKSKKKKKKSKAWSAKLHGKGTKGSKGKKGKKSHKKKHKGKKMKGGADPALPWWQAPPDPEAPSIWDAPNQQKRAELEAELKRLGDERRKAVKDAQPAGKKMKGSVTAPPRPDPNTRGIDKHPSYLTEAEEAAASALGLLEPGNSLKPWSKMDAVERGHAETLGVTEEDFK